MAVLSVQKIMLYCPKCRRTYQDGVQRFCIDDGGRLQPAPTAAAVPKTTSQSKSVFTNLLNRNLSRDENDRGDSSAKHPVEHRHQFSPASEFQPADPFEDFAVQADDLIIEENEPVAPPVKAPELPSPPAIDKPIPRLIKHGDVPVSQASLGDRSVNPTGREALTWDNPEVLIGQTIKGRYKITKKLNEDETSIAYLAEDKLVESRKAVVRVLMEEYDDADDLSRKIFAEERVSLSHINHPNVAHLIDSGELHEGYPFIVSEYVAGSSLKEKLFQAGQFNTLRTARIIRQAANALSEVHQNGILHRNLRPQNIILAISENGIEQVKVTDFAVFDGFDEQNPESRAYLSPEQLEGKLPSYASDSYSLAVIAFQMLTGRLPFIANTERELLKAQKGGLSLLPTNLRLDVSPLVDSILEKALAYNPSGRYPKARDFGDALFNALTTVAPWEKSADSQQPKKESFAKPKESPIPVSVEEEVSPQAAPVLFTEKILPEVAPENKITIEPAREIEPIKEPEKEFQATPEINSAIELPKETGATKTQQELPWEKRSPEPPQKASAARLILYGLGILVVGIGAFVSWNFYSHRAKAPVYVPQSNTVASTNGQPANAVDKDTNAATDSNSIAEATPVPIEIESPPLPRTIIQPPNTNYFQSSKENMKGELAKNFRAFSFYYPNDWVKNLSATEFVDVARIGATGTPIEEIIVNYYESKGTFSADKEKFPQFVQQSNKFFESKGFQNYKFLSQGETKVNEDWKAYEMKFQSEGITKNGDKVTLWGRRLWIPAARQGIKSGLVITMFASSLSPDVKSADDIGEKGELADVLKTFEPASLDAVY